MFDGTPVELTEGPVEYENVPAATFLTGDGVTAMGAVSQGVSIGELPVSFILVGVAGEPQLQTYDMPFEAVVEYYAGTVYYTEVSGSVTVTAAGGVGGVVEGTFYATVEDGAMHSVTDGKFRVKRLPDDVAIFGI